MNHMGHKVLLAVALLVVAVLALAAGSEDKAGGLEAKWEVKGLDRPASVIHDPGRKKLYVSNVAGAPGERDGKGFISRVSVDGKLEKLEWVDGLDAPKGMAITGDTLYVADVGRLVEIDIERGKVSRTREVPGAKFLKDVAADPRSGVIYVSDMMGDAIYRLEGGTLEEWLKSKDLISPNGLLVEDGRLVVACWGERLAGFATKSPGYLKTISLKDKSIKPLGSAKPIGALDGLAPDGKGAYYATDYVAGKLLLIQPTGEFKQALDLKQGCADLILAPQLKLLLIPMMNHGKVVAYAVE